MHRSWKLAFSLGMVGVLAVSAGCFNLAQALSLLQAAQTANTVAQQQGLDQDAAQAAAIFFKIKTTPMTGAEVAREVNAISPDKISTQEGDLIVQVANLPGMDNYSINHCLRDRLRVVNINLYGGDSTVAPATVAMNATGTMPNGAAQPASCSGIPTPTFTEAQVRAIARAVKWAKLINIGQ